VVSTSVRRGGLSVNPAEPLVDMVPHPCPFQRGTGVRLKAVNGLKLVSIACF